MEIFWLHRNGKLLQSAMRNVSDPWLQIEAVFKEREENNPGRKFIATSELDRRVLRVLEGVAGEEGRSITDVALAYVLHQAPYVFLIVGERKVEHIRGNIEGADTVLSKERIAKIEKAYEFDPGFPHTFLSGSMFDGGEHRGPYQPGDVWLTRLVGKFDWEEALRPIAPA